MKNNISKFIVVFVVFVLLLSACNTSRYAYRDRDNRGSRHNHGVDNRNYIGY